MVNDLNSFRQTLKTEIPPEGLTPCLLALWYDAKGDWNRSHGIIQDSPDEMAAWIHAYLHRKEGDTWNADYWYRKAGRTRPAISLDEEWEYIANEIL